MIGETIFLFLAKVVTVVICIAASLGVVYVAVMFCYGFYHDYLRSPKKSRRTGDKTQ